MENKLTDRLCNVSLVFPFANNTDLFRYKEQIDKIVETLPQCKVEYRFMEIKANVCKEHEGDLPGPDRT